MTDSPSPQELLQKINALEQQLAHARQGLKTAEDKRIAPLPVESEKNDQSIFAQAPVGIVNTDTNGRYLRVNPTFAQFVGYSVAELLTMDFMSITHPDDQAADAAALQRHSAGDATRHSRDKRYIRKDGSIVWGNVSTSIVTNDEEGKPAIFLGIIQNIHARKLAEEALKESEYRYRVIFENSPLGIIRFDHEGTILHCNNKFFEITGTSPEKVIGFNTAKDSTPEMRAVLARALAGEYAIFEDTFVAVTGGKALFLRVVFNPINPGTSPTAVIATVEDVSKRKEAEAFLDRRLLALTQPLTDATTITFQELFNLDDIQRLQDEFAKAAGVASIITSPDGTPITKPSNFTRLCKDIIRTSAKGLVNCQKSDAALGQLLKSGPRIQPCLSCGLWDAGAGISVGGHHIANWLIGQVRDETQKEEDVRQYAKAIDADEDDAIQAFQEVPAMSRDHFAEVARVLFTLANLLSTTAYHNVQQARYITDLNTTQKQLQENENRLRFALEGANDGLWDANLLTGEVYFSHRSYNILGYSPGEEALVHPDWKKLVHPDDFPLTWSRLVSHFKKQTPIVRIENRLRMKNGEWKWVLTRGKVVDWAADGRARRITGTLTDISDRKKVEDTQMYLLQRDPTHSGDNFFIALAKYLAELLEMDFVCIDRLTGDRRLAQTLAVYTDGHYEDNQSYALQDTPCGEVVGKAICCYPRDVCQLFPKDAVLQEMGAESYVGTTLWNSKGVEIGLIAVISRKPLTNPSLTESILKLVAIRAASELERLDDEQEKTILQAQLQQAQKLESVGRLAGGVAHDFNNMLGVILGHIEMAEEQVDQASPLFADLQEVKKAANRSADLTRQLLAFARKQTVSPKVLDLNEVVEGILKMLRRLIGENIELAWLPGNPLWEVKIDPTQIVQILTNLMVNARDAIAEVGMVSIETENIEVDEEYCASHLGLVPGRYVLLSVSDTGCGMDRETLDHIFEPFFTTKDLGQGTGLGLATIYGIVKQNGGFIHVYSEPKHGTTFRIHLPKYLGKSVLQAPNETMAAMEKGRETILLVEDEPAILHLGKRMLEKLGYHVLAAATPGEALHFAEQSTSEIHLLLTDVVMPEMNGRDLAKRLLTFYPNVKRLFMSGYTADVIAHHGILEEAVQFIQKPFTKADLSVKVRETLDRT